MARTPIHPIIDGYKKCNKCGENRHISEYRKASKTIHGIRGSCVYCDRKLYAEYSKQPKVQASHRKKMREYVRSNRHNPDFRKRHTVANQKWLANNINARLAKALRIRLRNALKDNDKNGSAASDLGCTLEELKVYLETKFEPGMTWDNWTTDGWHIDHIKPLHLFDLTDRKQLLQACHYTNLRPMWAKDNLSRTYEEYK